MSGTARRVGIRAWLFGVAVVATLPAILLVAYVGERWGEAEHAGQREQLARRSEAMATAVARRLEAASATLAALAESEAMQRNDFAAVHAHAARLLSRGSGGGTAIILASRDGTQVFNTRWPFGTALTPAHWATIEPVFLTGKPYVSDLFTTPSAQIVVTTVNLPIVRDGRVAFALRLSLEPPALTAVLQEQQLPPDWIGVLLDRSGTIIARTRAAETYVGQKGVSELLEASAQGERGWYKVVVKEGVRMEAAFAKLPSVGWTAAVGVPEATLEQPLWASVKTGVTAGAVLMLAGFVAAWMGARAIERQAEALAAAAKALGRGETPALPSTTIHEFQEIGVALMVGADLLRRRDVQRERERAFALAAKAEAEQADAAKSRFLAAASHDLRQPFQAMRLFYEVLLPHVGATGTVAAARLNDAMRAGEDLLGSLLDVSTLDAGTVRIAIEPFAVSDVLSQVAAECEPQAAEKGLRLRWVPCSARVVSDRVLLARMVRNLVVNAIRYTDRGGVVVGCRRRGEDVLVEVWDSGIGIADADLPHLFEDFFQVENPERDRTKGLGLGLAVVARMGRLLGHAVTVRSRKGYGSVFSIVLRRGNDDVCNATR